MTKLNFPDRRQIVEVVRRAEQRPGQYGTETFREFAAFVAGISMALSDNLHSEFKNWFDLRHELNPFSPSGFIEWHSRTRESIADDDKIAWLSREFRAFLEDFK